MFIRARKRVSSLEREDFGLNKAILPPKGENCLFRK